MVFVLAMENRHLSSRMRDRVLGRVSVGRNTSSVETIFFRLRAGSASIEVDIHQQRQEQAFGQSSPS